MTKPKLKALKEIQDVSKLETREFAYKTGGIEVWWGKYVNDIIEAHHAYLLHLEERIETLEKLNNK